jgi:hypothetical protein
MSGIIITAQSSKKIPKKWLCAGAHAPAHNHFLGYFWRRMGSSDTTLRCNIMQLKKKKSPKIRFGPSSRIS